MRFVDIDKVKKWLDENKPDWDAEDYATACEDAEFYSTMDDFLAENDVEMMMFAPELVSDYPEWIPCSERLPKDGELVLIAHVSGAVYIADRDGKYWEEDSGEWYDGENVTHWMPLPEPPDGGAENAVSGE